MEQLLDMCYVIVHRLLEGEYLLEVKRGDRTKNSQVVISSNQKFSVHRLNITLFVAKNRFESGEEYIGFRLRSLGLYKLCLSPFFVKSFAGRFISRTLKLRLDFLPHFLPVYMSYEGIKWAGGLELKTEIIIFKYSSNLRLPFLGKHSNQARKVLWGKLMKARFPGLLGLVTKRTEKRESFSCFHVTQQKERFDNCGILSGQYST